MEKEASILNQLISSLEQSELQLETSYKNKDFDSFARLKKTVLQIQNQIMENIK